MIAYLVKWSSANNAVGIFSATTTHLKHNEAMILNEQI